MMALIFKFWVGTILLLAIMWYVAQVLLPGLNDMLRDLI